MRKHGFIPRSLVVAAGLIGLSHVAAAAELAVLPPIQERFADGATEEVPSFQKHVVPLFGRLGCNGRACHGSFQGQGGFQLSLFGYDFAADHAALLDEDSPRVDREHPAESLILVKPTDEEMHEGGVRYERGSWQHHVLRGWIEAGAEFDAQQVQELIELQVVPSEIQFAKPGQQSQLRAIAVWADGTREDVTTLCRFHTNNADIAPISDDGVVSSKDPGDTHVVVSYDKAVVPVPVIRPVTNLTGKDYPDVPTPTEIDRLVVQKLRKLGVVPSDLSTDEEFLRRVSLDLTGTLPTPQEVVDFLADQDPAKREKKIDELLESPAYAAWWTTKLCDFTGNNDDQLQNVLPTQTSSQDWYNWIYRRVAENAPYDELVAGIVTATSRQPGQDYREYCEQMSALYGKESEASFADLPSLPLYWARRDFREPEARAIGFAYAFMGIRIQCAQCHKHPFDQWSKEDFHLFKNFFSGVATANNGAGGDARKDYNELISALGLKDKRGGQLRRELTQLARKGEVVPFPEVYVGRPRRSREYPDMPTDQARLLGGETVDINKMDDPRELVMQWLRQEDNRFFAPAFVNRVWSTYFHVGIVHPPDDHSLANPPSNKPLLDYLANGFIQSGFDMKWVHRTILNSRTYQLSWRPNDTNRLDERNFSRAMPRRLPAEVAYDAVQQATASSERVAAARAELEDRAIALAGSSARIRGNRDDLFALAVFGRSTRESNCDCDRSAEPSLLQTVFLQNDRSVLEMIEADRGSWLDELEQRWSPQRNRRAARQREQAAAVEKQLAAVDARLRKMRKSGDAKSIEAQRKRRAQLAQQLEKLQPQEVEAGREPDSTELATVVDQAYLRTLSRFPDEQEKARSLEYIGQAETPVDGVRDLLWALLNTKEFIVNH